MAVRTATLIRRCQILAAFLFSGCRPLCCVPHCCRFLHQAGAVCDTSKQYAAVASSTAAAQPAAASRLSPLPIDVLPQRLPHLVEEQVLLELRAAAELAERAGTQASEPSHDGALADGEPRLAF